MSWRSSNAMYAEHEWRRSSGDGSEWCSCGAEWPCCWHYVKKADELNAKLTTTTERLAQVKVEVEALLDGDLAEKLRKSLRTGCVGYRDGEGRCRQDIPEHVLAIRAASQSALAICHLSDAIDNLTLNDASSRPGSRL